jgi:hypothetical protein
MYESYTYHPYNSLVPNILNLISQKILHYDIMPSDQPMFMEWYYMKPYKNESLNDYCKRVPVNLRLENKIWGGWLYMIFLFLPLFIIQLLNLKVEKIKKEKIKKMVNDFINHLDE